MKRFAIAIDGPNGAGKSTVARETARRLGCVYIDTGAMYRAVGLYVRRKNVPPDDRAAVAALLPEIKLSLRHGPDGQHVFLSGEDVSEAIRTPEASIYAATVSKLPEVRAALLDLQRRFAREGSVVMDGRDIGTVVLPDAEVKIFLTASVDARARRRYDELRAKGQDVSFEEVKRDLEWRDRTDSTRDIAPLRAAEDAVTVDTTGLDIEGSVEAVLKIAKERGYGKA